MVRCPVLDFSSGVDLGVMNSNPILGSTLGMGLLKKKRNL